MVEVKQSSSEDEGNLLAQEILRGNVPTNQEISKSIDSAIQSLSSLSVNNENRIATDLKQLLSSSKLLLMHKNSEEQIQTFFHECSQLGAELASLMDEYRKGTQQGMESSSMNMENMIRNMRQLLDSLKHVVLYWIQSSEFRALWTEDIVVLAQNLVGNIGGKTVDLLIFDNEPIESFIDAHDVQMVKDRFNSLLGKIAHNSEYRTAIRHVFDIWNQISFVYGDARLNLVHGDHLYRVLDEAKKVFASFCGGDRVDAFVQSFWSLVHRVSHDDKVLSLWKRFQVTVEHCLQHPEEEMYRNQLWSWIDEWYWTWSHREFKFRTDWSNLCLRLTEMFDQVKRDEDLYRLKQDFNRLVVDMFKNSEGRFDLVIMQQSLHQIRDVLYLTLKSTMSHIQLPRVDGRSDTLEYSLENMVIDASDILPSHVHIRMVNDIDIDSDKPGHDYIKARFDLLLSNIRLSIRNIHFHYRRLVIPKVEDFGAANVDITGEGLQIRLRWNLLVNQQEQENNVEFDLSRVQCKIDRMNVEILDSQHRLLSGIFTNLFTGYLKKQVADALVDKVRTVLAPLSNQIKTSFHHQQSSSSSSSSSSTSGGSSREIEVDPLKGTPKSRPNIDRGEHEYLGSSPLAERLPLLNNEDSNYFVDKEARITTQEYSSPDFVAQIEKRKDERGASGAIYSSEIGESVWRTELESVDQSDQSSSWDAHWWSSEEA